MNAITGLRQRLAGGEAPALAGVAAALLTVTIWSGWVVGTRHAVTSGLDPAAVGLLRFGLPALVFAPWWLRRGLLPRGVAPFALAMMVAGAGAPFLMLAASGMQFAPAADVGALLPGTMPLFAALIGWALLGERQTRLRVAGFAMIAAGIVAIGGSAALAGTDGAWRGHLLFLAAAACWAGYTHAYRRTGLTPFEAAGLIGIWSVLILLPAVLWSGGGGLVRVPAAEVWSQLAIQGGLSGVVALASYGFAVARLGATGAAAFSALVPGLAALFAIPLLGELPGPWTMLGIASVSLGVALATGAIGRNGNAKAAAP